MNNEELRLSAELTLVIRQESALSAIAEQVALFDYLKNPNDRHPVIREIDRVLRELGYREETRT